MVDIQTAMTAINARISAFWLEKVYTSANNKSFRDSLKAVVEDEIQKYPVIVEYNVVCDNSNNTSEVINNNKLVIDISLRAEGEEEFRPLGFVGRFHL